MEDSTSHHQIKLSASSQSAISELCKVLQEQHKRLDKLQEDSDYLSQINVEIFNMVNEQQQSNPMKAIEATKQEVITLNQGVTSLGQGVWKIYQHLEKDSMGKELKSGQQSLKKIIEANSQKKNTTNIGYLDWKQIAIIITAAAIVSSLCSLAVFQVAANWKTDRTPTPTEKPLKPEKAAK